VSSKLIPLPPEPGQIVHVRQRLYLVEETVRPPAAGDATLVHLHCVDDDAQGQPLSVLWEKEVDPRILSAEAWDRIAEKGFDDRELFSAYMHTLRWNSVTTSDPRLFQAPFRAGIRIDAYQLEPLRKALLLPRVNLFIADDVGLGKTIEAGLIARELLLRRKVRDIVVACPPSMLSQWQEEMEQRFGLTFVVLDRAYVARVRQERGYGINPWTTHARFLVSHRLLVDEEYAAPLRAWLGELRPGSLLILDEAHHAAPSSGARYAIDSKITRAVRDLAPRFEHRLFLSATPHNGHSNSFSALLEILDPQRFCRGVPIKGVKELDEVMVRRLKDDVRELVGGFPKREVVQVDLDGLPDDAPELALARLLDEYRAVREERLAGESKRARAAAGLLICGLQQRLLSSVEAFARTLRVHRKTVRRQWDEGAQARATAAASAPPTLDLLTEPVGSDDERADLTEDELRAEEDAQVEAATDASAGSSADQPAAKFAQEQALLDEMSEIAERARGRPDARVRWLVDWMRQNMCAGVGQPPPESERPAPWNDTRILIFTEWDDTKRYLVEQLEAAITGTDRAGERIEVFHGPTPPEKREHIKRAFNAHPSRHPVRILVATDAAREGLNLQAHCSNLFHFDVPWNPSRMEQRNGRIDRKLQPEPTVHCHYFVYLQRPEDRVLQVLVEKTKRIKRQLGSLAQVVEGRLAELLAAGIRRDGVDEMLKNIDAVDPSTDKIAAVRQELDEEHDRRQDVRQQIERLRTQLEYSRAAVGLEESAFRAALSRSLEMLGAEPLRSEVGEDGAPGPARFLFPALDRAKGGDPSWADALDALRPPRRREQKQWDWRREAPIRPVVFTDPYTMDEDVVQLHLEHRVVRRLLGRFTAQGFVRNDLSRACLAHTRDAIPRVVLLGRLALFGSGGVRLHEEIVPLTARWTDPEDRKPTLSPYGRQTEARTLDLLEEALAGDTERAIPSKVAERLRAAAPRDVRELLPHLEERAEEEATDVERKLEARGAKEAEAMRAVLERQLQRVASTAAQYEDGQLSLDFDAKEQRQLQANRRHWAGRLVTLERELETEPKRIQDGYVVRARRIEPVGLVYLWPVTG
jgi:superfamily II DNA or RNA helicase